MNQYTLTTCFIFFSFLCLAQNGFKEGYIIDSNGVKKEGQLLYRSGMGNYKGCTFRQNDIDYELDTQGIREFGYAEGRRFVSGIDEGLFVEVLVMAEGGLSLFKSFESYFLQKNTSIIHITKNDRRIQEVEDFRHQVRVSDDRWKGLFISQMQDCLSFSENEIRSLRYSVVPMVKQVKRYNACKNVTSEEVNVQETGLQLSAELMTGVTVTLFRVKDGLALIRPWDGTKNATSSFFAANFILRPNMLNHQFSIVSGLTFNRSTFSGGGPQDQEEMVISSVTVPMALRFSTNGDRSNFFFQMGLHAESSNREASVKDYVSVSSINWGPHLMIGTALMLGSTSLGVTFGTSTNPLDANVSRNVKVARFWFGLNVGFELIKSAKKT